MTQVPHPFTVHATALVIGEAGVLIEGASGSGKSALALACIEAARAAGRFACLISDDRVRLLPRAGRLIASAHPVTAGQIERRGLAIERSPFCSQAVLRLVAGMVSGPAETAALPRLPWEEARSNQICGISLPFLPLDANRDRADQVALVFAALGSATFQD